CGLAILTLSGWLALDSRAATGESYEDLVKDMLGTVEQITKVLIDIRDEGSANLQRPALKKAAEKMLQLRKQADEFKQPNKAEKDRLAKEYAPKFESAVKKMRDETIRVKGIPGGDEA